jgi:hypothetical protein
MGAKARGASSCVAVRKSQTVAPPARRGEVRRATRWRNVCAFREQSSACAQTQKIGMFKVSATLFGERKEYDVDVI